MQKIIILLFITVTTFGQKRLQKNFSKSAAIEFLLKDAFLLQEKPFSLTEIITEAKKFGYYIYKEDEQFVFDVQVNMWDFKLIILEKDISDYNYEFFPNYSHGTITKYFYLHKNKDESDILNSWIQMIDTKISLREYPNVSRRMIDNYFFNLEKYYKTNYINKFRPSETKQLFMENLPKFSNTKFSTLISNEITLGPSDYPTKYHISYGSDSGKVDLVNGGNAPVGLFGINTIHNVTYLTLDNMKMAIEMDRNTKKGLDELKYFINDIDIREISMYDLTSMVSIFLDDCAEFNIPVPNINSLKATFEPLEGNTIALAYGMNLDDKIVIKVDPTKWQKASVQKKWYILYHELGHDVLNLDHGEAGKMMFNFAEREYTWEEFFEDKEYMFKSYKK